MGNRFSRRQNVPEKEAENEATEEAAAAQPTQESAATQEVVKTEAPEEKNEASPPECQQVETPAAPPQKDDADPKAEEMECQAAVESELPMSTEPEAVAQAEALVDSLASDAKAELPPEPVSEPELASTKDGEVEVCSEAISVEEPSSEVVTEPESAPSPDTAPTPSVETKESSELVPEPDSTSGQEAASEPEPEPGRAEPESVTCTEADMMADPIPNSEPEPKPDAEDESAQPSESEGEPASISQPEAMMADDNQLQQDLLPQELPEQISLMPTSVNADATDDTPSPDSIPDSTDTDTPSDLPIGDQSQEEEPAVSLEPKEAEEAPVEPLEPQACNDVNEESVCESLKNLELKGNDLVDDVIPSDVELSTDTAITDVSTSTELM